MVQRLDDDIGDGRVILFGIGLGSGCQYARDVQVILLGHIGTAVIESVFCHRVTPHSQVELQLYIQLASRTVSGIRLLLGPFSIATLIPPGWMIRS
jgi:hypothetical protein